MRALTTDMTRGDLRPYFLWDETFPIEELRAALGTPVAQRWPGFTSAIECSQLRRGAGGPASSRSAARA